MEGAASVDAALANALADIPGAAAPTAATAGVVVDGSTLFLGGAGTADDGAACAEAAATTVFVTASISKTFIAALSLQCAERGELDLDADVNVALSQGGEPTPGPVGNPHFAESPVTARHLLQHRSGLVDNESNLESGSPYRWPAGSATAVGLAEYVQRELARGAEPSAALWSQHAAPGSAPYHYSNAGFTLLGLVIERAAGIPLPELARARLFGPLGMDATAFFLSELQGREELRFAAPRGQPEPGGHYEVAEYPAAQVRSTAADLCRWLSFLTRPEPEPEPEPPGPGPGPAQRILSRESIEAMLPSSGSGSLAWWGMDAQYSEKRRGQFEHGGFMQGIRSKQTRNALSICAQACRES